MLYQFAELNYEMGGAIRVIQNFRLSLFDNMANHENIYRPASGAHWSSESGGIKNVSSNRVRMDTFILT
jgi:hypothetical protein